jgi:hypothetical protein
MKKTIYKTPIFCTENHEVIQNAIQTKIITKNEVETIVFENYVNSTSDLDELLQNKNKRSIIQHALAKLTDEDREVLGLPQNIDSIINRNEDFSSVGTALKNRKADMHSRACRMLLKYFAAKKLITEEKVNSRHRAHEILMDIPLKEARLVFNEEEYRMMYAQNNHYPLTKSTAQKIVQALQ